MTDDGWTRAKKLAKQWKDHKTAGDEAAELAARFRHTAPSELIRMWEKGENEKGEPLSDFEAQSMAEAWVRVFGDLPPTTPPLGESPPDAKGGPHSGSQRTPRSPFDDLPDHQIIRRCDVPEMLGVSLSTVGRWEQEGKLPNKVAIGERSVGWFVRDLKEAWRQGLCRPDGPAKRKPG